MTRAQNNLLSEVILHRSKGRLELDMAKKKKGSLTLSDVAQHAGYSVSTASFVFQNNPVVAASTREKILASARELGYVYNRRAASVRSDRSQSIGIVVGGFSNPFFGLLIEAIEEALSPEYTVVIGNSLDDAERQSRLVSRFLENRVDGLMIVPSLDSNAEDLRLPVDLGIPVMVLSRFLPGLSIPYFGLQDETAGELAAGHLISHGVSSISYFGGPEQMFTRTGRKKGVVDQAKAHGVEFDKRWCADTKITSDAAYRIAKELLSTGSYPEGIVCHTDAIAIGLMRAFHERGVQIGSDVRVIGFDDIDAPFSLPALTSIFVDGKEMGKAASETLRQLVEGVDNKIATGQLFEPTLVLRDSCGTHAPQESGKRKQSLL